MSDVQKYKDALWHIRDAVQHQDHALDGVYINREVIAAVLSIIDRYTPSEDPTPTGETVRVRAGFWWKHDHKNWTVHGYSDLECMNMYDRQPDIWIEAPVPLPRIPVVEARVVEEKS